MAEDAEEVAYLEVKTQSSTPTDQASSQGKALKQSQSKVTNNSALAEMLSTVVVPGESQDPISGIPPFVYVTDLSTNGTRLKRRSGSDPDETNSIEPMAKKTAYLLSDGDEIHFRPNITLVYHCIYEARERRLTDAQLHEYEHFKKRYQITDRVLGKGGFGTVYMAIHKSTTIAPGLIPDRQLACKVIDLSHIYIKMQALGLRHEEGTKDTSNGDERGHGILPTEIRNRFREFNILKDLDHPNIISSEKVYYSSQTVYIFQDLMTGGDLFTYLEYKGGNLSEVESSLIIRQVLEGVKYLHDEGIVHRDLKPDNVLLTSLAEGGRIVITDFGNARYLPPAEKNKGPTAQQSRRMFSLVGTLEYTAPEVHKRNDAIAADEGYSKAIDMWSIGAITAHLLTGDVIFTDRSHPDFDDVHVRRKVVMDLASTCDLSVLDSDSHPAWSRIGRRPKTFVRSLLVLDENERLTVYEALAHSWFTHPKYVIEMDELYERAIKDWKPRRKQFEMIKQLTPDDSTTDFAPNGVLSDQVVSRYFAPPQGSLTTADTSTIVGSPQRQRPHTPLPTISEEYEDSDNSSMDELSLCNAKSPPIRPSQEDIGHSLDQLAIDSSSAQSSSNAETQDSKYQHDHDTTSVRASKACRVTSEELGSHSQQGQANTSPECISETPPPSSQRKRVASYMDVDADLYDDVSQESASDFVSAKHYADQVAQRRSAKRRLLM